MNEVENIDKLEDFLEVLCDVVELIDNYRQGDSIFKVGIKGYKLLSNIRSVAKNMPEASREYADLSAEEKEDLKDFVEKKVDLDSFEIAEPLVEALVLASLNLIKVYNLISRK